MPPGTPRPRPPGPSGTRVVAAAVRRTWRRTREQLKRARAAKAEAQAHKLRVALRRLLSALALAKPLGAGPPPKVVQELERLLRSLSPLRDLEVEEAAVQHLAKTWPVLSEVSKKLERKRASLAKHLAKRLAEFPVRATDRAVEHCVRALDAEPAASQPSALLVLGAVLDCYEKFDRRRRAVAAGTSGALHRVRVAFKHYRYAVEIALPLLPARAARTLEAMKSFQDELGAIQDARVLHETLKSDKIAAVVGRSVRAAAVRAVKEELRQRERAALDALALQLAATPPRFSEILP